jgi:hypothetical protein
MWVWAGYGVMLAISVLLVGWRYLQYAWHPQDANQYSGMWAGGDMILGVFIFCLFMVPTFFLVLVARTWEPLYIKYAKVLVVFSLTAPLSMGLLAIPAISQSNSLLGFACMWRLLGAPFVLAGMGVSRFLARFPRAKRLCSYAALIEGAALIVMVVLLGVGTRRN